MISHCSSATALLALLLLLAVAPADGQRPPVVLPGTEQLVLRSTVNDVSYKLYVSLPRGYDDASARYPVVYVLDADYSFAIARNIVEHLSDRGHLTAAVIIGIAYDGPPAYRRHRTRDYTPTYVASGGYGPEYQAVSGGGPLFLRFIAEELIPFVEREYRVTQQRVLVGHSYGGLFVLWVALHDTQRFSGYVAVSPSLWYDDHLILRDEQRLASTRRDMPVRLHLSVGSREINDQINMVADLRRLAATLEKRSYPGLRMRWSVEEDETHPSIFPGALSDGLRFVLQGQ
ncbi:MAG TPA: alpha/beta hydrolase-fold protein [Gemmatimonadaceae bacterium]|nr:alpha/beta hydrolase-fold protein [Gemmatimonadaceae bacterium]